MGSTSATALESLSASNGHYVRDRVRAFFRGVGRFGKMLVGLGSPSSQEGATHLLLLVGFCVEGIVLFRVISDRAGKDLPFTAHEDLEPLVPYVLGLLAIVTLLLFCHQFLIFRNFSVPTEVGRRVRLDQLAAGIGTAVASFERNDVGSGLSILRGLPISRDFASPDGHRGQRASLQSWIEKLVFLIFGVLTGEAGYSLTVLHEHNAEERLVLSLERALGTEASWGLTLGCIFLACAAAICILVLVWDATVIFSVEARERFGTHLLAQFFIDDILSLAFWLCLFCVVTPTARLSLGARGEYPVLVLGHCSVAWFLLLILSSLYVVALGRRVLVALVAFGSEPTYDDARYRIV